MLNEYACIHQLSCVTNIIFHMHTACDPSDDLVTYVMIGDNVDFTVVPTNICSNKQKLSLHFFQSCAVRDRVDLSSSSSSMNTTKPVLNAVMSAVHPSKEDNKAIACNLRVLISRILIDNVPYFNFTYSDLYPAHIIHKYSKEMSMKSEVVSNCCTNVS